MPSLDGIPSTVRFAAYLRLSRKTPLQAPIAIDRVQSTCRHRLGSAIAIDLPPLQAHAYPFFVLPRAPGFPSLLAA